MEVLEIGRPHDNTPLTRGERFQDARMHMPKDRQTLSAIEKETGVQKSMISALESDKSNRDVGYSNIAILAKHYGVSADWLLGLTNDPYRDPPAVDELGLSASAIREIRKNHNDTEMLRILSRILASNEFWHVILEIKNLRKLARSLEQDQSSERTYVQKKVDEASKLLHRSINEPVEILTGEKYLEYAWDNIIKNLAKIIQSEIPLKNNSAK